MSGNMSSCVIECTVNVYVQQYMSVYCLYIYIIYTMFIAWNNKIACVLAMCVLPITACSMHVNYNVRLMCSPQVPRFVLCSLFHKTWSIRTVYVPLLLAGSLIRELDRGQVTTQLTRQCFEWAIHAYGEHTHIHTHTRDLMQLSPSTPHCKLSPRSRDSRSQ